MKKVKFKFFKSPRYDVFTCHDDENRSGEYVSAEVAEELLAALKEIVAPGGRANIMQIAVPVIEKYDK